MCFFLCQVSLSSGVMLLSWSGLRLGVGGSKGERSTWRTERPPAFLASCGLGFPAPQPARHWGATVGWGPSLQLWLSPRGTCRTLGKTRKTKRGGRECEFERTGGKNVAR